MDPYLIGLNADENSIFVYLFFGGLNVLIVNLLKYDLVIRSIHFCCCLSNIFLFNIGLCNGERPSGLAKKT